MNVDTSRRLQAPFAAYEIEWRVGSTNQEKTRGMALAYVTNRAIQNRLDDVFGPFGWQNVFREWGNKSQLCGISVRDDETGDWVTKWDGADNTDFEPTKGGLSDSMKRAACQWGIGRYLYKLDATWVPITQRGKTYVIEPRDRPNLPKWALPEGAKDERPAPGAREKEEPVYACQDCGTVFEPFELKGKKYSAEDAYNMAVQRRGRGVCKACYESQEEKLPWEA